MRLSDLASIGSLISSAAVVISLVSPRASNPTSGEKPTSFDLPGAGVAYDRLDDTDP